jgi:hypothetical protein
MKNHKLGSPLSVWHNFLLDYILLGIFFQIFVVHLITPGMQKGSIQIAQGSCLSEVIRVQKRCRSKESTGSIIVQWWLA